MMGIEVISGAGQEGLPLSEAVKAGDFIFLSGMVGFDPDGRIVEGGISAETDSIMRALSDILGQAGATLANVVKANAYLAHADDFEAFNRIYASYFPVNPPARTGLVAGFTIDARIEMDFIAYVGK